LGFLLNTPQTIPMQVGARTDKSVVAILKELGGNAGFWREVDLLCRLLEPLSKVVMGIQRRDATLADCALYWLYLAVNIAELLPSLPPGKVHTLSRCTSACR